MKKERSLVYLFNEVINFKHFIISLIVTNVLLVVVLWSLSNKVSREILMAVGLVVILVEWIINVIVIKPERNVRVLNNGN